MEYKILKMWKITYFVFIITWFISVFQYINGDGYESNLKGATHIKIETICTDGIDNDGDGLIDGKDGDCWIREGGLFEMIQRSPKGTLTFKEQEKLLPLLADMGIKTIYLTPIWKYKPGTPLSRYYILNYYQIDPEKGTIDDFKHFVNTAHSYGIKILLDLVTGHTGPGRYIYENHKDWILHDKYGNLAFCWPHKGWGYAVDRANPEVIKYFTKIAKFYIDKFNIDGWRVDAIGTQYCNESIPDCPQPVEGEHHSRDLLRSIKEAIGNDKVLYLEGHYLGRIYYPEDLIIDKSNCPIPNPVPCWMMLPKLNEFAEASYSYEFGRCFVIGKILTGQATSEDLVNFFKNECIFYGKARGRFLMTHDFGFGLYSSQKQFHKPGAVLITTIPGFPHIYHRELYNVYMTEIDQEMVEFYRKLLSIRDKYIAIKYGSIENVWKSGDNIYAYLREYEDEKVIVLINFQYKTKTTTCFLNLPFNSGVSLYDVLNNEFFLVNDPDNFEISVSPFGSRILVLSKKIIRRR